MSVLRKELAIISQKLRLQKGKWITTPPFGYQYSKTIYETEEVGFIRKRAIKQRVIQVDENASKIVIDIFYQYSTNSYSLNQLSVYIKEKYDKYLPDASLSNILNNKFYIGIMEVSGEHYSHNYACFISKEIFYNCQKNLKKNSNKRKCTVNNYVFSYHRLLKCAYCYHFLRPVVAKKKYTYYFCASDHVDSKMAIHPSELRYTKTEDLDKEFLNLFSHYNVLFSDSIISHIGDNNIWYKELLENIYYIIQNGAAIVLNESSFCKKKMISFLFPSITVSNESINIISVNPFKYMQQLRITSKEVESYFINADSVIFDFSLKSIRDLVAELKNKSSGTLIIETISKSTLSDLQQLILNALSIPCTADQLSLVLNVSIIELQQELFDLQLSNFIDEDMRGYWRML